MPDPSAVETTSGRHRMSPFGEIRMYTPVKHIVPIGEYSVLGFAMLLVFLFSTATATSSKDGLASLLRGGGINIPPPNCVSQGPKPCPTTPLACEAIVCIADGSCGGTETFLDAPTYNGLKTGQASGANDVDPARQIISSCASNGACAEFCEYDNVLDMYTCQSPLFLPMTVPITITEGVPDQSVCPLPG